MQNIKIETSRTDLTANVGMNLIHKLYDLLDMDKLLKILPQAKRCDGGGAESKLKSLMYSFAIGGECLDDLDGFRQSDRFYRELSDGGVSSKVAGNFLRSFNRLQLDSTNDVLLEQGVKLRKALSPDKKVDLNMDSTEHKKFGKKMEGVKYNYQGFTSLNSVNIFDDHGISYGFQLRPGGTYTSKYSELILGKALKRLRYENFELAARMDSGFCKKVIYNTCLMNKCRFTIVLKECYAKVARRMIMNKQAMKWRKTDLYFFDCNNCEIASGMYPVKYLYDNKNFLRMVCLRAPKKGINPDQLHLFDEVDEFYVYYTIVTDYSEKEKSNEDIVEFHRVRSGAENNIKDQKYGYALDRFPCQKLDANYAYGLICNIAYNMMKYLSHFISPNGCHAKKIRTKLIKLPAMVVSDARNLVLRMSKQQRGFLEKIMKDIEHQFSRVT